MKKTLFLIAAGIMMIATAHAQNSVVEAEQHQQETKAEKFLKECDFYRTDTYVEMEESGIRAWAKVTTNLVTNEKIGYCYFMTESKEALAMFTGGAAGGSSKPLGYLDMDEIDDMIKALNKLVEISKQKNPNEYSVDFITKAGINIHYNSEDNKVVYSKKWYYVNEYGVKGYYTIYSPTASIKAVTKTITMLEKAKTIINQNL